jgi:hypothetical protein
MTYYEDDVRETEDEILTNLYELCGKKGEETTVTRQQVFDTVGKTQFCNPDGKEWVLKNYSVLAYVS